MNQSRFLRSISRLGIPSALLLMTGNCAWGFDNKDVAVKVVELPERDHGVVVQGVSFSADGDSIAVDSDDENINIWNWRKQKVGKTITKPAGFISAEVTNPLSYSLDGHLFAACGGRGADNVVVRVWNAAAWSIAKDISDVGAGHASAMTFTPDIQFLLYAIDRGPSPGTAMIVLAVDKWQPAWDLEMPDFHPVSMAVSPNGKLAAVGGSTVSVQTNVDGKFQQLKYIATINLVDLEQHKIVRTIHGDTVGPIVWSPDGGRIATGGNKYVEIFSATTGERLVDENFEGSNHVNLRFTPDGRYLLESDMNGKGSGLGVRIWDGEHRKLLQTIKGNVASIAVSRDGKYFALGSTGSTTVWQFKGAELSQ
jgi:WD40 repeat protein